MILNHGLKAIVSYSNILVIIILFKKVLASKRSIINLSIFYKKFELL